MDWDSEDEDRYAYESGEEGFGDSSDEEMLGSLLDSEEGEGSDDLDIDDGHVCPPPTALLPAPIQRVPSPLRTGNGGMRASPTAALNTTALLVIS